MGDMGTWGWNGRGKVVKDWDGLIKSGDRWGTEGEMGMMFVSGYLVIVKVDIGGEMSQG
jgi:hypothetical protein